jgi:hypothetical protein
MKRRWLAGLLLVALSLAACTPADGGEGADGSGPAPADIYDDY